MRTRLRWLMALGLVAATAAGCGSSAGGGAANGGRGGGGAGAGGTVGGSDGGAGVMADAGSDAGWSLNPPETPDVIDAPAGATVLARFRAVGVQIYTCAATPGTSGGATYAWTLKAPEALLYDAQGHPAGTHGAGPTWTANDGSSVKGMKLQEAASPAGDAIAWLLLRVTTRTGAGLLAPVSYVQRVNTTGGKAPAGGCDSTTAPTEESRAAYSADYYFYTGGPDASPDAGQPDATGCCGRRGRGSDGRRGARVQAEARTAGAAGAGTAGVAARVGGARVRPARGRGRGRRRRGSGGGAGGGRRGRGHGGRWRRRVRRGRRFGRTRGRRRGRKRRRGFGRRRGYASRAHGGRHVPGRHVHLHHRRPHGRALRGGRIIAGSRRAVLCGHRASLRQLRLWRRRAGQPPRLSHRSGCGSAVAAAGVPADHRRSADDRPHRPAGAVPLRGHR